MAHTNPIAPLATYWGDRVNAARANPADGLRQIGSIVAEVAAMPADRQRWNRDYRDAAQGYVDTFGEQEDRDQYLDELDALLEADNGPTSSEDNLVPLAICNAHYAARVSL
jgi:hypothetical protein